MRMRARTHALTLARRGRLFAPPISHMDMIAGEGERALYVSRLELEIGVICYVGLLTFLALTPQS